MGDDVVHKVRRGLRHAPRAARRAEPAALAAEGQQLVVPALAAAQPQEAVRQDAAFEEGVELVLDEPGQFGTRAGFGVGDEAGRVPRAAAPGSAPFGGEQLARWRAALKPLKCELALPKFVIAPQAGSLKSTLQGLGVMTVFTEAADLRPMLGRGAHQMHLDDVYQAAGITVDEQGGEAVAAAAATVRSKSLAIPVPPCAVDRAFSFALLHQATGTPLFVGRVGDPARTE